MQLIDGHLRADVDPSVEWPVLVLDVTEEEADKILATHDPRTMMAEIDTGVLDELLSSVKAENESTKQMLANLSTDSGINPPDFQPVGEDEQGRLDQKAPIVCPNCNSEFVPK